MGRLKTKIAMGIRLLRLQQNLSQESLGERCGLDRTYISGIERCSRNITIDSLERVIVLGLKISTCDFFKFIEGNHDKL